MRKILIYCIFLIGLTLLIPRLVSWASPPPPNLDAEEMDGIETAILQTADEQIESDFPVHLFDVKIDQITLSDDADWATGWILLANPETGEIAPTEPIPAIAFWDGDQWQAVTPADTEWADVLTSAPADIQKEPIIQDWIIHNQSHPAPQFVTALAGYLLPWEGGRTVYLSRSVAHDSDFTSGNAHYSFDFYVPQTMFNIHAAKPGTVWLYKDSVPNNDHSDVNYLVLQDTSTNPVTYQLYLHLAQSSIPLSLKSIGVPVAQGTWIGIADNTGQSTGHHLHFQVESEPYWTYWGRSVDIVFSDVDINGGRPRVAVDFPYCTWAGDICQVARSAYVSGNYSQPIINPPIGDIIAPLQGNYLSDRLLTLEGWANDPDKWVAQARFIARYGELGWQQIGPSFNASPFVYQWDVCNSQVPDGPFSLALQILDADGNWAQGLPGLRHIIKDYSCPPPPSCAPTANQVALFAEANFGGNCTLFSTGTHTSSSAFSTLGVNNAESIRVGASAMATLYMNNNLSGRGETFITSDSNLSDNWIGINTTSSLRVQARSTLPSTPILIWPPDGTAFPGGTSQSLAWDNGGGGLEYQVEINGVRQSWTTSPYQQLGSLTPGSYSWRVRASNLQGLSGWSAIRNLSVADQPIPPAVTAPFSDGMENGYNQWGNSSNWDQSLDYNHTTGGQVSWKYEVNNSSIGYDNGSPNSGDLTSPPIIIPTTGYYLRFWYLFETEDNGIHHDPRWIQVSSNGGNFTNLVQLANDPPNVWLHSPVIDLSAYAGSTIRIRFHFDTYDAALNSKKGWYIDDFSITQSPPPSCTDTGEPDNSPAQARWIDYNTSLSGAICPPGDLDYYRFTASSGETGISTSAQINGSALDTHIFLLDSDGKSVIASNDDQVPTVKVDSYLSYQLTPGETYTILVRAWDHPSAGGENYHYALHLYGGDHIPPAGSITSPVSNTFLPGGNSAITVAATDPESGVSRVDFYSHSGDWQRDDWAYLGTDWDSQDGWSYNFDSTSMTDQLGIAIHARIHDWAGNYYDTANWNLGVDRTPPSTAIQSLPASQSSTVIQVHWTATDNLSGLNAFDLQQKTDSGAWQNWLSTYTHPGNLAWYVGSMGHSYSFRMRGVDRLGNQEAFPTTAEATTAIPNSVCSGGDSWENDNAPASATIVSATTDTQVHNYCNPASGAGWMNDQDWFRITLPAGKSLFIFASPKNNGVSSKLQLYSSNGTTLLTENTPTALGQNSFLYWKADQNTTLYLKAFPLDQRITGAGSEYQLSIHVGYSVFLPNIRLQH